MQWALDSDDLLFKKKNRYKKTKFLALIKLSYSFYVEWCVDHFKIIYRKGLKVQMILYFTR